jgi:NADPH:quinone reductase-like Zn-dependent oxidoreductase
MTTTAQAWQFEGVGGPELLRLTEHELDTPGPGEALVRIRSIGLNRADLLYLAGRYYGPPPSPSFIGQEAVGEVVALGPELVEEPPATRFDLDVGCRVGLLVGRIDFARMGTYRTAGIFRRNALLPIPATFSFTDGAGLWLTGLTAIGGLRAGGLTSDSPPGQRVLVTAASSGVGVMTLQIARTLGATTFAATTSPAKVGALKALADHVIVASTPADLIDTVKQLTDGAGVDVAFDPVGFAYAPALMQTAAVDGHVVVYGLLSGTEAPLDLRTMIFKDLGVHGFTVHRLLRNPDALDEAVATIIRLADQGSLRPIIAHEIPFEQAPEALRLMERNEHLGKIVLTVDE